MKSNMIEITVKDLQDFMIQRSRTILKENSFYFSISGGYICHVIGFYLEDKHDISIFDNGLFYPQLIKMIPAGVLDRHRFDASCLNSDDELNEAVNNATYGFGIEDIIPESRMFEFYKKGCEIVGVEIPMNIQIESYKSWSYSNSCTVDSFHRTMAKIGLLEYILAANPDASFEYCHDEED